MVSSGIRWRPATRIDQHQASPNGKLRSGRRCPVCVGIRKVEAATEAGGS
jgi:hypothetical protein